MLLTSNCNSVLNLKYYDMQSNKIIELGKTLPTGSFKLISDRTGKTQKTVGDFFEGKTRYTLSTYNSIMDAAIEIVKGLKEKENVLSELLK